MNRTTEGWRGDCIFLITDNSSTMDKLMDTPEEHYVLIVDDDPDICEALGDLLEGQGYRTQRTGTGFASLALLKERRFAAVILNVGLPDIDGLSVLRMMREQVPGLQVIILTGSDSNQIRRDSIRLGAFAFLAKPWDRQELKRTVARAVRSLHSASSGASEVCR
jgi:DNA-binding response OmpR family regulator